MFFKGILLTLTTSSLSSNSAAISSRRYTSGYLCSLKTSSNLSSYKGTKDMTVIVRHNSLNEPELVSLDLVEIHKMYHLV